MKIVPCVVILLILISTYSTASSTKLGTATAAIETFSHSIELFKLDVGRYPTTDEGLKVLLKGSMIERANTTGYIRYLAKDPWGFPYQYKYPGTHNKDSFDIWSNGADGTVGGDGYNGDIGNWPGASKEHKSAYSKARKDRILRDLPMTTLIGVIFSGSIYLAISLVRLSDGVQRKRSFTGKSLWIALVFFSLYWLIAFPLIAQS